MICVRNRTFPRLISVNDGHYLDAYLTSPNFLLDRDILFGSKPKSGIVCDMLFENMS